jgi:hypothetical protein
MRHVGLRRTLQSCRSFCATPSGFWHVTGVTRCLPKTLDERSALPPKADITDRDWHVRFVPMADIGRGTKTGLTS